MTTDKKSPRFYTDTDARMAGDADFRACVMLLMNVADRHGYTPGDLKQIAFRAALELEMRRPGYVVLTDRELAELDGHQRRGAPAPTPEQLAALSADYDSER